MPNARFDYIHINLLGPLPPSNGYSYILTCIDRLTRWAEAIPIVAITAETIVCAFVSGWVSHFESHLLLLPIVDANLNPQLWKQLVGL